MIQIPPPEELLRWFRHSTQTTDAKTWQDHQGMVRVCTRGLHTTFEPTPELDRLIGEAGAAGMVFSVLLKWKPGVEPDPAAIEAARAAALAKIDALEAGVAEARPRKADA
jgi:hypothetical protein